MEAARQTQITRAVTLRITFREHGIGRSITQDLDFMIFPGMSERIILGNPCLNDLGFASNKHSIELRAFGIEFPTILSEEVSESPQGERGLRINSNYNVQPVGGGWMVQTVWCHPDKGMFTGKGRRFRWIESPWWRPGKGNTNVARRWRAANRWSLCN